MGYSVNVPLDWGFLFVVRGCPFSGISCSGLVGPAYFVEIESLPFGASSRPPEKMVKERMANNRIVKNRSGCLLFCANALFLALV